MDTQLKSTKTKPKRDVRTAKDEHHEVGEARLTAIRRTEAEPPSKAEPTGKAETSGFKAVPRPRRKQKARDKK